MSSDMIGGRFEREGECKNEHDVIRFTINMSKGKRIRFDSIEHNTLNLFKPIKVGRVKLSLH